MAMRQWRTIRLWRRAFGPPIGGAEAPCPQVGLKSERRW